MKKKIVKSKGKPKGKPIKSKAKIKPKVKAKAAIKKAAGKYVKKLQVYQAKSVSAEKLSHLTPQARGIYDIIQANGGKIDRNELLVQLQKRLDASNSAQKAARVLSFYKSPLCGGGYVSVAKTDAAPATPVADEAEAEAEAPAPAPAEVEAAPAPVAVTEAAPTPPPSETITTAAPAAV